MLDQGYGIIPNKILFDKTLKDKEKLLFVMISSLCAEKGYCRANNQCFAEKLGISKTNISRYISSLQKKGYISSDVSKDQGNKRHISIAEKSKRYCGKQQEGIAENSKTPIAENSKHNNTIKNNIKNNKKEKETLIFPDFFSEKEKDLFNDFLTMRKEIKKPATMRSQEILLKKLQDLGKTEKERIEIIEQAIVSSRQSFYPLKNQTGFGKKEREIQEYEKEDARSNFKFN